MQVSEIKFLHYDILPRYIFILAFIKVYHSGEWLRTRKEYNMGKKLMIVDDDPDILIAIRRIFEREGFEVLTVDSGKDCLYELEKGFKGVILMDIMMPFMDGWDTIKEIVEKGFAPKVTISIVTAIGTPKHEKINGLENYIHDYIAKPFDVKQLISNVKNSIAM